jgi:hypothetical protein
MLTGTPGPDGFEAWFERGNSDRYGERNGSLPRECRDAADFGARRSNVRQLQAKKASETKTLRLIVSTVSAAAIEIALLMTLVYALQ